MIVVSNFFYRFFVIRVMLCYPPIGFFLVEIRGLDHAEGDHMLRQVESYLMDTGMAGLASAWAMARRRLEYHRKVNAATRCPGVCPHT